MFSKSIRKGKCFCLGRKKSRNGKNRKCVSDRGECKENNEGTECEKGHGSEQSIKLGAERVQEGTDGDNYVHD